MTIWQRIAARKLRALAHDLWLPPTATREQVAAAIEQLSDHTRRDFLRQQLQGLASAATTARHERK